MKLARTAIISCLLGAVFFAASPALAQTQGDTRRKVDTQTTQTVQKALKKLGFASVKANGETNQEFKNILCSWREIMGEPVTRKQLSSAEAKTILSLGKLPAPRKGLVVGLNVNRQCQSTALIVKKKDGTKEYRKIFRVSTGAGGYATSPGKHFISRRIDGLHNSTAYPSSSGWNMYRPAYFAGYGEAFHGSPSDSSVSYYPSSHGCVRMLQKDVDYLWRTGSNAVGTKVYVYGNWVG